jgi:hypothetical protein
VFWVPLRSTPGRALGLDLNSLSHFFVEPFFRKIADSNSASGIDGCKDSEVGDEFCLREGAGCSACWTGIWSRACDSFGTCTGLLVLAGFAQLRPLGNPEGRDQSGPLTLRYFRRGMDLGCLDRFTCFHGVYFGRFRKSSEVMSSGASSFAIPSVAMFSVPVDRILSFPFRRFRSLLAPRIVCTCQ